MVAAVGGLGVTPYGGHVGPVQSVAYAPNSATLAVASIDGVRIWDTRTGQQQQLTGRTGPLYSLAYAPDGATLATGGQDGTVRIWDTLSSGFRLANGALSLPGSRTGSSTTHELAGLEPAPASDGTGSTSPRQSGCSGCQGSRGLGQPERISGGNGVVASRAASGNPRPDSHRSARGRNSGAVHLGTGHFMGVQTYGPNPNRPTPLKL
jgi:WD40 repeat protein